MNEKDVVCDLIRNSIIEDEIIQIIDIDICCLHDISRSNGTYILIFEKGKRKPYVGSTRDIRKRLFQHRYKTEVNIEAVIFLRTKDMKDALLLEDWIIRNLDCSNKINAIKYNTVYSLKKGISVRSDDCYIERRKLSHNKQRDQVQTTLNTGFLHRIGIEPGSYVNMIYDDTYNIVIICSEENLSHVLDRFFLLKDATCPTCGDINLDRNCKKCNKTY